MATVHTPVPGFTGTVLSAHFVDGTAQVNSENELAYFERHGYKVIYPPVTQSPIPNGDPSDKWSVEQLKAYAAKHHVALQDARSKAEILEKLSAPTGNEIG